MKSIKTYDLIQSIDILIYKVSPFQKVLILFKEQNRENENQPLILRPFC